MADPNALILKMSADISGMQKQISAAVGIVDTGSARMVLRSKEAAAAIEKSFGTVTVDGFKTALTEVAALQDRLAAAQLAGNAEEAKALRAELQLRGAVQKAATAQLETQLALARATGNKGQVAQLTEALALQSQISKFQGVGLNGTRALTEAERAITGIANAEKAAEGANVGRAIEGIFDRAHVTLYEEAGAKIPLFGSALEALGPAGLAAAAGVAALAIAAESARKAMEWAADLDGTAKKLGVTTTSLQQLDYASVATSIGLQQGREALSQFNGEIGKFEAHTGDKRLVKWADGIKLTRAEVSQTIDPIEKLSLVMEKIAKLPNAQERTAAAKAFGLDGLLPIINEGTEGIDKFIGKMKEARENGSIVDARTIREAAELNDKVEELSYRIGVDFKKAFIDLAPVIERVAEFIERCTHALAGFLGEIPDAIRGVEALIDKLPHIPTGVHVSQDLKDAAGNAAVNVIPGGRQAADILGAGRELFRAAVEEGKAAKLGDKVKDLLSGKPVDLTGSDFDPAIGRQGAGEQLSFDKPKGSKHDETLTFDKAAQDAYDSGLKALIEAQKALTDDIEARGEFEQKAVSADLAKKLHDLDIEEQKIHEAKNDSNRTEQLALIEKAKTEEQNAAKAKLELIARDTLLAVNKKLIDDTIEINGFMDRQLQAQASIAATAQQRADLELEVFKARQYEARLQYKQSLVTRALHQEITPGEAQDNLNAFDKAQGAEISAERYRQTVSANPILGYLDKLRDVNSELQNEGVKALDGIAGGIADIVANGAKAGDVLRSLVRQLLYDFTRMNVQHLEAGVLGKLGVKLPDTGAAAAATTMTSAITTGGATAATEMGTAITTAGTEVATQLAAALAAGGGTGGLGSLFNLAGASGFNFGLGGINTGAVDFGSALSGWGGGFNLTGFADGTDGAPGGWARINERGPEGLAFLPPGTKVIPNDVLRNLSRLSAPPSPVNQSFAPTLHVSVVGGGMSASDARRTGAQIGAAAMKQMAMARKAGF